MIEELIQNGDYQQALGMLVDTNDETTRYLRLVCLIGLQDYQQASQEGMIAKASAQETYYDVVSMYVTALKELGEFEDAIQILIEELSMPYIPYQYEILFNTAYDEVLLEKQEANYEIESNNHIFSIQEIGQILKNKDCNEDLLYLALDQLQQLNIRMIIPTVQDYLINPERHFFPKTLLIEIMIEQEVDEDIQVEKFGAYFDINPSYMPLVLEQSHYQDMSYMLSRALEMENPTLFAQCLEYLEYTLYALYPQDIDELRCATLVAAIHYNVATLQSIDIDFEDLEILYQCDGSAIEQQVLALKQIEC